MTFKYVIAILVIMAFILPSSAMVNLTYPDEYYNLKSISDNSIGQLSTNVNGWLINWAESATAMATQLSFIELHRQSILMEKQNELLAEQNALLRKLVKEDNGLIYYESNITQSDYAFFEKCYQNETGQDPNDLVMHFTCPNGL